MRASDILEMKVVAGRISLIAGGGGLDRKIKRVTVMEAPDLPELLSGGELVLTTLYQLRHDIAEQEKLVRRMDEKGVSALVIKMGRFVSEVAPEVRAAADEVRLPLMTVTRDVVFRDLIYEVVRHLVEEDSENRDSRIVDAVIRSEDVREICRALEEIWGIPCALVGPGGNLIDVSSETAHREYIAWSNAIRGRLAGYNQREHDNAKGPIVLERQDGCPANGSSCDSVQLFPCRPGGRLTAFFTLFGPSGRVPVALTTQVASVLALRLLQDASAMEKEHADRFEAIESVLTVAENAEIAERMALLGLGQAQAYTVLLCRLESRWQDVPHVVGRYISQVKTEFPLSASAPRGTEVLSIVGLRESPPGVLAKVRRQVAALQRVVSSHPSFVGIAVGSFETEPSKLRRSYENCKSVARLGGTFYDDFLFEVGLSRIAGSREMAMLERKLLGPVLAYDRQYGSDLMKTLELYVKTGDPQEVADRLHLHSNTVRYRLRKIAEMTAMDPETPRGLTVFSVLLATRTCRQESLSSEEA